MRLNIFLILTMGVSSFLNCLFMPLPYLPIDWYLDSTVCSSQGLIMFWKDLNEGRHEGWRSFSLWPWCLSISPRSIFPWLVQSSLPANSLVSSLRNFHLLCRTDSLDCYTHRSHKHGFFLHPFKMHSINVAVAVTHALLPWEAVGAERLLMSSPLLSPV